MANRGVILFGLAVLCAGALSCQSLESIEQRKKGELKIATAPFQDAIPSEYGKALGVTLHADNSNVADLWFEKPDGTIVVVSVDCRHGRLSDKALVIPRR